MKSQTMTAEQRLEAAQSTVHIQRLLAVLHDNLARANQMQHSFLEQQAQALRTIAAGSGLADILKKSRAPQALFSKSPAAGIRHRFDCQVLRSGIRRARPAQNAAHPQRRPADDRARDSHQRGTRQAERAGGYHQRSGDSPGCLVYEREELPRPAHGYPDGNGPAALRHPVRLPGHLFEPARGSEHIPQPGRGPSPSAPCPTCATASSGTTRACFPLYPAAACSSKNSLLSFPPEAALS